MISSSSTQQQTSLQERRHGQKRGKWRDYGGRDWSDARTQKRQGRIPPETFRGSVAPPILQFCPPASRTIREKLVLFYAPKSVVPCCSSPRNLTQDKRKFVSFTSLTHSHPFILPSSNHCCQLFVCHHPRDILTEPLHRWQGHARSLYKWGVWSSEEETCPRTSISVSAKEEEELRFPVSWFYPPLI